MNILLIANGLSGKDGWSRYSVNLRDALVARSHRVEVLTPPAPLSFLSRPWRSFFLAQKIRRFVQENPTDVLHFTVEPYATAILFLPKEIVKKTILTIHGNYGIRPFRLWRSNLMTKMAYRRIPKFITVSRYTKDAVIKELRRINKPSLAKRFEERATVIHNGIPLPPFSSSEESASADDESRSFSTRPAARGSLEENVKQILHVGGIKPAKGVGEAIEACALYKEKYGKRFHLTIIGTVWRDHYLKGLELEIKQKHLEDYVTFRGPVSEEELASAYRNADLLLVPSVTTQATFEGFGLVYIEANAYGVPVIGPHVSGSAEAIKDGVSGYQIDVFHPEMIAMRIHWILDEERIKPEECRKWAEEHSIETVAAQVEKVYSS